MSELTKRLKDGNIRGVVPPQDWTSRAVSEIESLERQLAEVQSAHAACDPILHTFKADAEIKGRQIDALRSDLERVTEAYDGLQLEIDDAYDNLEGSVRKLAESSPASPPGVVEAVAKFMLSKGFATGHGDSVEDLLAELGWQIDELRSALTAEARSPWIPVGERLPEMYQPIIAFIDIEAADHPHNIRVRKLAGKVSGIQDPWMQKVCFGYAVIEEDENGPFLSGIKIVASSDGAFRVGKSDCITHWMPLPDAPSGGDRT